MAWAKKKELREKIKKLKAEEDMLKSLSVLEPYSEFGEHNLLFVVLKMLSVMVVLGGSVVVRTYVCGVGGCSDGEGWATQLSESSLYVCTYMVLFTSS